MNSVINFSYCPAHSHDPPHSGLASRKPGRLKSPSEAIYMSSFINWKQFIQVYLVVYGIKCQVCFCCKCLFRYLQELFEREKQTLSNSHSYGLSKYGTLKYRHVLPRMCCLWQWYELFLLLVGLSVNYMISVFYDIHSSQNRLLTFSLLEGFIYVRGGVFSRRKFGKQLILTWS